MNPTNPTLTAMMKLVPATTPDAINYGDFRFRAEVDWVQIYFRTVKPTNHWTVTNRLSEKYAKALDQDAGGAATRFMVKFQNPQSWQDVQDKLDALTEDHDLIEGPDVAAIEISFDAYSKFERRDDLIAMAGRFFKYSTLIGHQNVRASTKGDSMALGSHRVTLDVLGGGYSVYAGDHKPTNGRQRSDQALRIYVKEVDAAQALPVAEHRARIERTLHMYGFMRRPLSRWKQHDFTSDAKYFKFRKLKALLPACIRPAMEAWPQVGERREMKRIGGGGVRRFRKSTVADTQLNRLAYEALRNLTSRMQYVSPVAKNRNLRKLRGSE